MISYSIKEAVTATGTSVSSIRRFFEPIRDNPEHPLRSEIEPSVEQVNKLRRGKRKPNFKWKLSRNLLEEFMRQKGLDWPQPETEEGSHAPEQPPLENSGDGGTQSAAEQAKANATERLITMLETELGNKNTQLSEKDDRIKSLQDQIASRNAVMIWMQKRLAQVGGPEELEPIDIVDGQVVIVEPSDSPLPTTAPPARDARKANFFRRVFDKMTEAI